jgi:hypothetical protein
MIILPGALALILSLFLAMTATVAAESGFPKPNILLVAIDDLNDWIGSLGGHGKIQVPLSEGTAVETLHTSEQFQGAGSVGREPDAAFQSRCGK